MRFLLSLIALVSFSVPVFADEALAEVNAKRAARGLRPYIADPALTQAAQSCASYRAANRMFGHVMGGMGDFQFLPPGSRADSAGCAAYPASYGFMACCVYDNYTYAGAASVLGADGRTYHQLFVSNTPNAAPGDGIQLISNTIAPPTMTAPAPVAAPTVQYQVQHRGLFGRKSVLVPVTQSACAPAIQSTTATTTVGGCAGGSCSLPGRTTVRSHLTIRQR